jgi:hypothetical protein
VRDNLEIFSKPLSSPCCIAIQGRIFPFSYAPPLGVLLCYGARDICLDNSLGYRYLIIITCQLLHPLFNLTKLSEFPSAPGGERVTIFIGLHGPFLRIRLEVRNLKYRNVRYMSGTLHLPRNIAARHAGSVRLPHKQ